MNLVSALVTAIVVWWLVFFLVLPLGGPESKRRPKPGTFAAMSGAPASFSLWKKIKQTSLLALPIFLLLYLAFEWDILNLRRGLLGA